MRSFALFFGFTAALAAAHAQETASAWQRAEKHLFVHLDGGISRFTPGTTTSTLPLSGYITALATVDHWIGMMGEFQYDGLAAQLGWSYQAHSATARVEFPPYGSSTFKRTNPSTSFRVWRGRIGYEWRFRRERFAFQPFFAIALNQKASAEGPIVASSSGLQVISDPPDTVRTLVKYAYKVQRDRMWTGGFGGRLSYRTGRMLFGLTAEYLASEVAWYTLDVIGERQSTVNGNTSDEARITGTLDRWTFGATIGLDLLTPREPDVGHW